MQVQDLLTGVGYQLGLIAAGESLSTSDQTLILNSVNWLIDSWNAAVLKSLNGQYAALIAQINAGVQKALAEGYDPSLYTFNALSTGTPFFTFHSVSDLVNLTDTISLPNGWVRALVYNAAIEVAAAYGRQITPEVAQAAADSKAAILTPPNAPPVFGPAAEQVLGKGVAQSSNMMPMMRY